MSWRRSSEKLTDQSLLCLMHLWESWKASFQKRRRRRRKKDLEEEGKKGQIGNEVWRQWHHKIRFRGKRVRLWFDHLGWSWWSSGVESEAVQLGTNLHHCNTYSINFRSSFPLLHVCGDGTRSIPQVQSMICTLEQVPHWRARSMSLPTSVFVSSTASSDVDTVFSRWVGTV